MEDLTRNRILRKLEVLPDDQLYQVLDFIEFLEHKYAPGRARQAGPLERFAERLEDGMRARAVTAAVMTRTMKTLGTASQFLDDLTTVGRELFTESPATGSTARVATAHGGSGGAGTLRTDTAARPSGPARLVLSSGSPEASSATAAGSSTASSRTAPGAPPSPVPEPAQPPEGAESEESEQSRERGAGDA